MTPEDEAMQERFEAWFEVQFNSESELLDITEDGYADPIINALWVGFYAGVTNA